MQYKLLKKNELNRVLTKQHIISEPASKKKALLPYLSTQVIEISAAITSAPLVKTDEYKAAPEPKPKL
jgi:hypothetical protein